MNEKTMKHKTPHGSDHWHTPPMIFRAMSCEFDLDVAAPSVRDEKSFFVPAKEFITENSLEVPWHGFVFMNPPYSGHGGKIKWLKKFFEHGNGIALMTDDSSTKWWHYAVDRCDLWLHTKTRVKFIRPDGSIGGSPANNTCLFAIGEKAVSALKQAEINGLGVCVLRLSRHE